MAFHEAFLNALVHRDYSLDGMISVNFTGDKLSITSPGGFYGGVTAENIALHEPRHRNKALAKTLMLYNLVDRAGMGVLRMGLRSLIYGRSFPTFTEKFDSIDVSMHAEYLRPAIFVKTCDDLDRYGITELLLMNNVYETGYAPVKTLQRQLKTVTDDPWRSIQAAIKTEDSLELCGNKSGVFVRAKSEWTKFYQISKAFRTPGASDKHVKTYAFLKKHGESSNEDITRLLGHNHSSQTSAFLRDAEYVQRTGSGPSARWYLVEHD